MWRFRQDLFNIVPGLIKELSGEVKLGGGKAEPNHQPFGESLWKEERKDYDRATRTQILRDSVQKKLRVGKVMYGPSLHLGVEHSVQSQRKKGRT